MRAAIDNERSRYMAAKPTWPWPTITFLVFDFRKPLYSTPVQSYISVLPTKLLAISGGTIKDAPLSFGDRTYVSVRSESDGLRVSRDTRETMKGV